MPAPAPPAGAAAPRRGAPAATALAPAPADARLIPPPGPWPARRRRDEPRRRHARRRQRHQRDRQRPPGRLAARRHAGARRSPARSAGDRRARTPAQPRHPPLDRRRDRHARRPERPRPADWSAVATARTSRSGRFRAVLPAGANRRTAVLYWPAASSPIFSRRLLVRAAGRVYLAKPYRSRPRTYRFDGKVSGAPIPAGGLLIALQVRNRRGNWVTARLARTNRFGRYRIRYTFPTRARLNIRIAAPSQGAWALYAGYSATRTIRP